MAGLCRLALADAYGPRNPFQAYARCGHTRRKRRGWRRRHFVGAASGVTDSGVVAKVWAESELRRRG